MAKRFSGNELALVVTQFSTSALTVIADIAIAVPSAASRPAANSGAEPTSGINRARKDNSIIATGKGSTGAETGKYTLV